MLSLAQQSLLNSLRNLPLDSQKSVNTNTVLAQTAVNYFGQKAAAAAKAMTALSTVLSMD